MYAVISLSSTVVSGQFEYLTVDVATFDVQLVQWLVLCSGQWPV